MAYKIDMLRKALKRQAPMIVRSFKKRYGMKGTLVRYFSQRPNRTRQTTPTTIMAMM